MLTFNPEISLGHLITLGTVVISFVFALGKLFQKIDQLHESVKGLVTEFDDHKRDDSKAFERVHEDIIALRLEVKAK